MPNESGAPAPSQAFLVITFVAAALVGVAIAYLGITGQIGAGIP